MKPGGPIRRTPLKQTPLRSRPKARTPLPEAAALWKRAVQGKSCPCGAKAVHGHHIVRQQAIRRAVPPARRDEAMWDQRNLLPCCEGCHAAHHSAHRRLPADALPAAAWDFARDHRLLSEIERYYAR